MDQMYGKVKEVESDATRVHEMIWRRNRQYDAGNQMYEHYGRRKLEVSEESGEETGQLLPDPRQ